MNISENLTFIKSQLPEHVTLVAVTKTQSVDVILKAYNSGHRIFGENKIQELASKYEQLPKDIQWHMIGHVQSNKVKYIAPFVSLIHGIDNFKLLKEVNKQAQKNNRILKCLLQIKIASEDSKFGMSTEDAMKLLKSDDLLELQHIKIVGLMGMATFTDNSDQIKQEFTTLKEAFDIMKPLRTENCDLQTISMGMSDDFPIAIKCGSTMVRIGSRIFGARQY